eukprot:TRINITY_DN2092_c0_g1_i1.p1 TRINITY_DN2092_c0_g1~~TRINITY_DN2092_c0_g1_i1.p1  ORF type:complete len:234 (+),score=53.25 TRINITY_DN2092_c0_g1_i1:108-809(+)
MASQPQKVVVLGSSGSGKTSLIKRFIDNKFEGGGHKRTKAVQNACYAQKRYPHVTLSVWDTAGEDKFRVVSPVYFNNAMGFVIVYDVTDDATLERAERIAKELKTVHKAHADAPVIVMGTKVDLARKSDGTMRLNVLSKATDFAESINAKHFVTSSKTGEGVTEAFAEMANGVFKLVTKRENDSPRLGSPLAKLSSPRSPRSPRGHRMVVVEDEATPLNPSNHESKKCCCVIS